jgi:RND family efflux transporter MFP subunit
MVAGAAVLAGCNSKATIETPAATPVRVAAATSGPAAPSIRTNGLLANKDEIRLAFKVGGVIRKLTVSEGERVRKGQRLAEIEQTEVNAQVEQARQARDKATRDTARGERLYQDKVISLEQLQDLRTQAAMAEAALNSAEFNWNYAAIVAPHDGTVLRRLAEERELVSAGTPVLVLGA